MKIKPEHFEFLSNNIRAVPLAAIRNHRKEIVESGKAMNIDMRLRWDILYYSVPAKWICDNLYDYLNGVHIDTALRHIFKTLDI